MDFKHLFFGSSPSENTKEHVGADDNRLDVLELSIDQISPNPFQPRKSFSEDSLRELADSIREFGVIQPLVVRQIENRYEIIAGERRLRASILCGRNFVPCILRTVDDREMAAIALIENLQRSDLNYFEEALGYHNLLSQFRLTQEDLAKSVGKDQSTIANKLRLLRLPELIRQELVTHNLSERHARALLKLESEEVQARAIQRIVSEHLTVKETDHMIESLTATPGTDKIKKKKSKFLAIVKDVRIFINTVGELVKQMNKSGLKVRLQQTQDEDSVILTMVIPTRKK